ncbi:hypothetical protein VOLCADRAFT_99514 [Volvox carteri f. nagariensis]|uniref:Uncharacterized protein n=1 Tax=Volvox carteri f. nagariensis TaxID=3068 RepID=D8UHY9_VOLCA|nr:uncharacterized protein VOLCADRAFT_99514 [Volvox carteri f. nagariensis]EFJ40645.1 hypothetical protein VOLCADRAFT_99514 [Volvox carteri f. nagariensis]|eukprot:XP_002958271.1 hypothetical protein VOLCADRAFT_99514 [Volvox carteri f. nagariensis]
MAADRGVPAEMCKAHGCWRTDTMVQHYMWRDIAAKLEVSRRLGLAEPGGQAASSSAGGSATAVPSTRGGSTAGGHTDGGQPDGNSNGKGQPGNGGPRATECSVVELTAAQRLHHQYSHPDYRVLEQLISKQLVQGPQVTPAALCQAVEAVCRACDTVKATATIHPSCRNRPQHTLEVVHSDLCVPMPTTCKRDQLPWHLPTEYSCLVLHWCELLGGGNSPNRIRLGTDRTPGMMQHTLTPKVDARAGEKSTS